MNIILLTLPHIAVFIIPLNGWPLMLFYVACMFFTFKITSLSGINDIKWNRVLLYTTCWIGMNYDEFEGHPQKPPAWKAGIISLFIGLILIAFCFWNPENTHNAILVFIAMIFIFHFGLLDLNAQVWNYLGRNAKPIMNEPWKAKNLADFWGKRWNLAFRDAVHKCIFTPIRKSFGMHIGMLAVFLFSGILHEAVISVPAKGGYGGPMVYFLIQFLGILIQKRTPVLKGRCFTWFILLAPLPLLFHQQFFNKVFIPLTNIIGV